MQREAERLIYAICAEAAGSDTPVVFAAYDAPLDKYPRVRIQAILGPDEVRAGKQSMQLADLTITVTGGPVQLVIANQVFQVPAGADNQATAVSLVDQIKSRTEWTVSTPAAGVFTVVRGSGRAIIAGHSSADYGCTLAEAKGDFVPAERVVTSAVYQVTAFSTESRSWLPGKGVSWITTRIKQGLRNAYALRDSVELKVVRTLPAIQTPTDRAGYVMASAVEFEASWAEPVILTNPTQTGRIECVEVTANGQSLEINRS